MTGNSSGLIDTILGLPIFEAEWVLWLLLIISVLSVAVMIERLVFYRRHRVDVDAVRAELRKLLRLGDMDGAAAYLERFDSLETNVVLFGLREHESGPDAVEDLIGAAARKEKARYEQRLIFLATVASNAPFIGLFPNLHIVSFRSSRTLPKPITLQMPQSGDQSLLRCRGFNAKVWLSGRCGVGNFGVDSHRPAEWRAAIPFSRKKWHA